MIFKNLSDLLEPFDEYNSKYFSVMSSCENPHLLEPSFNDSFITVKSHVKAPPGMSPPDINPSNVKVRSFCIL